MSRLDIYLTENSFTQSRERAKKLIKSGAVSVNGRVCEKPSREISEDDTVEMKEPDFNYVGRGLLKLEGAFEKFGIDVKGKFCADIGASTGGFTQCLLEHGAKFVYAVDVGHGQLDGSLAADANVKNCEGVNARYLTKDFFDKSVTVMSVDISFISLKLVMPALADSLSEGGEIIALIKPQFEAGKSALSKNAVVKNPKDHKRVLAELIDFFSDLGLYICDLTPSPITGGDGNIEYLIHIKKIGEVSDFKDKFNVDAFVDSVFNAKDKEV